MDQKSEVPVLEIWGGLECTINRVEERFVDQLHYSNHYNREEDIDLIAGTGIKMLRYPILWEFHQPELSTDINWEWTQKQLLKIRSYNIEPIAGLLHHGSGPAFTNLLDENFAGQFAGYAKKVATQFPWIKFYTPINEPLTTARFSGLYGFWYPHVANDISFAKMLINQVKGIVLSMVEIRKINPEAKLIQTEDLGKTYSTPLLQYQAKFENERRWLTYDLLCGEVKPGHPMWKYFSRLGIPENSLQFFIDNPCPPDVLGFNYYITSERYIDETLDKYPAFTHGGNEVQNYADVEAVRVPHNISAGLNVLITEAWERYKMPIAITEAQLNCTREEQMRWLKEIWGICSDLKEKGVNIRAVTAWSLFGAFGWNRLLTSTKMDYEAGAFDIRSGIPRPTALTTLIKDLAIKGFCAHPLLLQKGWWHKNEFAKRKDHSLFQDVNTRSVIIIGKRGTLGTAFARICSERAIPNYLLGREDVDITSTEQIENIIRLYNPWAIINTAGFVRVDDAEKEIEQCFKDNTYGAELLAVACKKYGVQLQTFSSDLVFDGEKQKPYLENDPVNPLNIYGLSKAKAEKNVLSVNPEAMIVRTSSFFGPWDKFNFVHYVLQALLSNQKIEVANDVYISPTYVPDLVNVCLDLLIDKEKGIWHLTNKGAITWAGFAQKVAEKNNLNSDLIKMQSMEQMNWRALRPKYSVLKSEKGVLLPSLDNALLRFFEEIKHPVASLTLKDQL